jgi:hypothetical protein
MRQMAHNFSKRLNYVGFSSRPKFDMDQLLRFGMLQLSKSKKDQKFF